MWCDVQEGLDILKTDDPKQMGRVYELRRKLKKDNDIEGFEQLLYNHEQYLGKKYGITDEDEVEFQKRYNEWKNK
jgi:hypothetical protein